jgi:hypothetical protein
MPIVQPTHVRTPAQIAATRVEGEHTARCASCSYLLVELPRPIRLRLPFGAPTSILLTHAHSSRDLCASCPDDAPDARLRCVEQHDPAPCPIPEPVFCQSPLCDLPAVPLGDYCEHCDDAR